ncbi:MAG: tripartite tricarboxylate transporter substrate-binding protein, partial [Pseudomonadota bacterium]
MYKAIMPLRSLVVAAALALTSVSAMADYPDRPLRVIVPFAAGGATDVIARTVAQAMSVRLGQSIVVENKAGANGNIGGAAAARSEPDGYTLLMATSSHAINASLYQ